MDANQITVIVLIAVGVIALAVLAFVLVRRSKAAEAERRRQEDLAHQRRIEQEEQAKAEQVRRKLREAKAKEEEEARQAEARAQAARAADLAVYRFHRNHPDGMEDVRLVGKPDEYAFGEVGQICTVEQDDDNDQRYLVLVDGMVIGALPSIAVRFAEKADKDPTELAVILTDVEYDDEKERDIFTVYIA